MAEYFKRYERHQFAELPETLPAGTMYSLRGVCTLLEPSARRGASYPAVRRMSGGIEWAAGGAMLDLNDPFPDWVDVPIAESETLKAVAQREFNRQTEEAPPARTCKECGAHAIAGEFCVYCDERVNGTDAATIRFRTMRTPGNHEARQRTYRALSRERLPITATQRELAKPHPWSADDVDTV